MLPVNNCHSNVIQMLWLCTTRQLLSGNDMSEYTTVLGYFDQDYKNDDKFTVSFLVDCLQEIIMTKKAAVFSITGCFFNFKIFAIVFHPHIISYRVFVYEMCHLFSNHFIPLSADFAFFFTFHLCNICVCKWKMMSY